MAVKAFHDTMDISQVRCAPPYASLVFTNAARKQLTTALQTANYELSYERSIRALQAVSKDEDIRKLRLQLLLLEDENEELHEQLGSEEAKSGNLESDLDEALVALEQAETEAREVGQELRVQLRELDNVRAELAAMEGLSTDSAKVFKEKLALTRELATVKPELEHLRSEVAAQQGLLAEKLSLQRQLSTVQVELDNEKRTSQRAMAGKGRKSELGHEFEAEIDELKSALRKAQRETQTAQARADEVEVDRAKLEAEVKKAKAIKGKPAVDTNGTSDNSAELEDAQKATVAEKKERQRAERELKKAQQDWETQRSLTDEKLNAFRAKLRETKARLKEAEAELEKTKAGAGAVAPAKNPRKRAAVPSDADATQLGTPGDGVAAKRTKRAASSQPGEKSTFSMTPFLNKTTSILEDSPEKEPLKTDAAKAQEEDDDAEGAEATPSAHAKRAAKKPAAASKPTKAKPLAPAAINKPKAAPARKKAAVPTLEKVTEESPEKPAEKENNPPGKTTTSVPLKDADDESAAKPKLKKAPRKSLADFASFNKEPEPEKKKKRKLLGGGLGKTLFDEEDGGLGNIKPIPGRGIFAARGLAKVGGLGAGANGVVPRLQTEDGFSFSPLKKDRRQASVQRSILV